MKPVVILTGPTASGKSGLGIQLAKQLDGEIISADSMQIYRGMDIGTAKAMPEQQQGIPHHLLDIRNPDQEFSVAEYAAAAREKIEEIQSRGKRPFLVGGTTLYLQAIADHIQFFDLASDSVLRSDLQEFSHRYGNHALWKRLQKADPALAAKLHPNNSGRVIRALEVYFSTQKPLSVWQQESVSVPNPYQVLLFGLCYRNRETLYDKINLRVDQMLEQGLLAETESLAQIGASKTALQAIGYKELWDVVNGEQTLEDAVELLKQSTRRYAKRQMTWMRSRSDLIWLYWEDYASKQELVFSVTEKIRSRIQKD